MPHSDGGMCASYSSNAYLQFAMHACMRDVRARACVRVRACACVRD